MRSESDTAGMEVTMFCRYCGNELPEAANFCPICGKTQEKEEPAVQTVAPVEEEIYNFAAEDPFKKDKEMLSGKILTNGILGIVFGTIFPLLGLIFSCIARAKSNSYVMAYDELDGRGRTGRGLATAGLIVSIVMLVVNFINVLVWIVELIGGNVIGFF